MPRFINCYLQMSGFFANIAPVHDRLTRKAFMVSEEKYYVHTLHCGLRIVLQQTNTQVTYAGFAINAGTRDEEETQSGMAHFVEHMLFKGTSRRKAWHILNRMEKVGGDVDAYTNKEETVVYSVFLREHLGRAVDLMADLVLRSTFPQAEIEKEADVIIGEIQSYEDNPAELIYDGFENLIFNGHPLGRNILGSPEALKRYRTADALAFYRKFYVPENMIFFVTGNYEMRQVVKYVEKALDRTPTGSFQVERKPPLRYMARHEREYRNTHQSHVMTGGVAYSGQDPKKTMLYLLANLLGGPGMNSRLNLSLREKRGLVYEVEANCTSYTDTGTFSIYFGCDSEQTERCMDLVGKELKKLCDAPLTTSQLTALKKQTMGQIGVAQDNSENNALGMAKTFLHYNRFITTKEVYENIEKITSSHLMEVANEVGGEANLSSLILQ